MATKVIILSQEKEPKKDLKKIELVKCLQTLSCEFIDVKAYLSDYKKITLLSKEKYFLKLFPYDLLLCEPKDTKDGQIWLGHFNDGVV